MFNIAICDNCEIDRKGLAYRLKRSRMFPRTAVLFEFACGEDFLSSMEEYCFSLAFLDVPVRGMAEFRIAKRIRELDQHVVLVFYAQHVKLSRVNFEVQTYRYLKKWLPLNCLEAELGRILKQMRERHKAPSFLVKAGEQHITVFSGDIICIEKFDRKLRFHLAPHIQKQLGTGSEHMVLRGRKLLDIYEILKEHGFGYPHDSYVINFHYVVSFNAGSVRMAEIPHVFSISRKKAKEFNCRRKQFLKSRIQNVI